jgi:hypothetical protein
VKSLGSSRAIKNFATQGEAVSWARSKSKKQGLDLFVHKQDGTIRFSNSYRKAMSSHQPHTGRK